MEKFRHDDITEKILEAFFRLYNTLGYGFLAKVYENALILELKRMGLSAVALRNAGHVVGKPANERFASLLAPAGVGATGESFAFDDRGVLRSESRFRGVLVERGSLRAGESSVLRQRLDDPESGGEPQFIRLVAQALAGRSAESPRLHGELLQAYATYYGERVVGAWRWLDGHGFGIAVEVSEGEALAPLRPVELALLALGAALGAVAFGFLVALLRMQRMAEQDEAAQHGFAASPP